MSQLTLFCSLENRYKRVVYKRNRNYRLILTWQSR